MKNAIEEAMDSDPIVTKSIVTKSLRFKYDCEVALKAYEDL